jgi:light-regulated signal transduction histidine kinase (bacteriophytochrome)
METIEIPRFLLDYFDSNTIRTPLFAIRGYADFILQGAVGPLTTEQVRYLEIIKQNAERLDQHFGIVLHNQHYLVWDEQVNLTQLPVQNLMDEFKEEFKWSPDVKVKIQEIDHAQPVWVDMRHVHNAFAAIANFVYFIQDKNKLIEITVSAHQKSAAITLLMEFNKELRIKKSDLPYYESFLYLPQRVMELHGGQFSLKNNLEENLALVLVFPNTASSNSGT